MTEREGPQEDPKGPLARAEEFLDEHTRPRGNRPAGLEDVSGAPSIEELRRQQQREMARATLGTQGQTQGAVLGSLAGAVIGVVVGLLIGLAAFDVGSGGRVTAPIVFALVGAIIGFVYWGGRMPELKNETMTATGEPGTGTTPRDPGTDHRGR